MVDELGRVTYLGPVRRLAQRDYVWSGHKPAAFGDDGAGAVDALLESCVGRAAARRRGLATSSAGQLADEVGRWLSVMGLADGLEAERLGKSARYELHVLANGSRSNLKDVGVGVSQVLPVIVAALFAQPGDIVIVEEPESHLHPMAQTQLAELFIEASQGRGVQFIIESHSEHLLLRLQRRVAERRLQATAVAMYFLQKRDGRAHIERLQMNEVGDISNWPDNFFGDDMTEIAARTLAGLGQQGTSPPPGGERR
jgi:predicted ATPase